MIERICIVPIEFHDHRLLEALELYLGRTFELPVDVRNQAVDIEQAFDISRHQYYSSLLLKQLIYPKSGTGNCRVLGVCSFDLFIPIFTYVFGEAQVDGLGAIVSTHRLRSEFYGGHRDWELLTERLIKEATHELGHTFSLFHCHTPGCVMMFSTYVEDIDDKSALFCKACKTALKNGK